MMLTNIFISIMSKLCLIKLKAFVVNGYVETEKPEVCRGNSQMKMVTEGLAGYCEHAGLICPVDSGAVSIFSCFLFVSFSLSLHLSVTQFCRAAAHIITFPTEILL